MVTAIPKISQNHWLFRSQLIRNSLNNDIGLLVDANQDFSTMLK